MSPLLVLNAGSSTLKYRLFDAGTGGAGGVIERIGEPGGPPDHGDAVARVLGALPHGTPAAVGHRVVHGGDTMRAPVRIDRAVEEAIWSWASLAPVHNSAALTVIHAAQRAFPGAPQIAVFDTAFHATLPPEALTYALDRTVARAHGLRRYGFHGISVRYVRDRAADLLGRPVGALNMIVLHLGSGASATALAGGVSVDTSMGMGTLPGLVMGTRCGDLDPTITFHLVRSGWRLNEIEDLYQRRGGLLGLCGESDMREVLARVAAGDADAGLALDVYCRQIRKYIGAYQALLGRLDAIVFTAGVGEHSPEVRERVLTGLDALGITLDGPANAASRALISVPGGPVSVCVVPTDEERAIAEEMTRLLGSAASADQPAGGR